MTIRIGVIGCGMATRRIHLPALRTAGFEVTAFASRTRASAETACSEWGTGDVCPEWRDVVRRDDVDAVLVATPNTLHAEAAVAAAAAGKHVLVEKPMASTLAEADAMIGAAVAAGTVLVPAHNLRFASPFVAMAGAVGRGEIGPPVAVRGAFGHGGPHGWAPDATWFYDPALSGGGALIDLGIHLADLVQFVTGDRITEVGAVLTRARAVEDAAQLVVRFGQGATGALHASWLVPTGRDLELTVFGTEGALFLHPTRGAMVRGASGEATPIEPPVEAAPDLYQGFAAAIERGAPPPVTAEDGRAALAVVEAAYSSAASGAFSHTA